MDFSNIQDGGSKSCFPSLSFNISETKYVIKNLTTDIKVTLKVPIDKQK